MAIQENVKNIMEKNKKTNGEVLHKVTTKRSLLNTMKKEMSIYWTYNKRKWGTAIAEERMEKW